MARTLGGDANQVVGSGKILLDWIGGGSPASQSLPRELSLSSDYEFCNDLFRNLSSFVSKKMRMIPDRFKLKFLRPLSGGGPLRVRVRCECSERNSTDWCELFGCVRRISLHGLRRRRARARSTRKRLVCT